MQRLSFVVVLAVTLSVAAATHLDCAYACSCAPPDPTRALAQADAAFVGKLVERREPSSTSGGSADPVVLVFEIQRVYKGTLPSLLELTTAASGSACGIEAQIGSRVGLFLRRDGGRWTSGLCDQADPATLASAGWTGYAPVAETPPEARWPAVAGVLGLFVAAGALAFVLRRRGA